MTFPRRLLIPAMLVSGLTPATPAAADAKQCAADYEAAQEFRSQTKLRAAREKLLACAQPACPTFVKKDCSKWLGEVESALPTVVFGARADGKELVDVTVSMDGETVAETLDGKAVPVDPGARTFVFDSAEHGKKEVRFVVKEGQKSQSLDVVFEKQAKPAPGGEPEPDPGMSVTTDDAAGNKTLAYVALGVGAVGLGGFVFFGLSGNSEKNDLECADTKTCTDDDLDPVKQKYLFADISLGVGIVGLAVGTYLLVSGPKKATPAAEEAGRVRFDVLPTRAGGFASLSGSF
jgi:hypothetical protein